MSVPPPPPRRARPGSAPADGTAPPGPPPRRTQPAAPEPTDAQAPLRTQVVVPPSTTRAQRRTENGPPRRSGGRRWGLVALAVIGVGVVVAAAAFFVLEQDSNVKSGPKFKASTAVDLQPGTTNVGAVGFSTDFPVDVQNQVLATLGAYVDTGIVAPLRTGKATDASLAAAFDPAAIARLDGAERVILLDENLPKAVGKITVTTPPVPLTALVDRDGKVVLVATDVQFVVKARTAKGVVEINHTGSFVLAPDASGAWKITGWTLSTDRGGPGVTPAPAASDATTTTVSP